MSDDKKYCPVCSQYRPASEVSLVNTSNRKVRIWKCVHCLNRQSQRAYESKKGVEK
jgi:ribosomal protein L37AE/L43A